MARTIIVGKTPFKYNVLIAKNALTKANLLGHLKTKNKVFIITDSGVPKKYLDEVKEILKNKKKCYVHILEQGEKSKSFSSYIPTTLLSQVDSSVGGKTAINIKQGKNLIGSFNNPSLVLISSKFIETLTEREFNSGLGEVIKYAFIGNKKLYKLIKENSEAIKNRQLNILEDIIEESIKTKAKIVTEDEKESGIRAILNFGHTFGHAIEAFNKYKNITHGEAVTIGMIIAAKISFYEGHIKNYQLDNVVNLIDSLGLNSEYKKYKYENLKKFILNDKKVSEGKLNLILINSSGKAFKTNKFNPKNLQKAFI